MNRRAFLALTPVAAVGGITTLLASPRAPQVQVLGGFTLQGFSGQHFFVPDVYRSWATITLAMNQMPVGSSLMLTPMTQHTAPPEALKTAQQWAAQNTPQGFHTGGPKIAIAGIIVAVIGICIMGFIFYWLWKWASTLLPPVDQNTNASPNDPYPAARGAQ